MLTGVIQGHDRLILGLLYPLLRKSERRKLQGHIFTFTELDDDTQWIDLKNMNRIPPEEAPKIPENAKPNMKSNLFVFDPYTHIMLVHMDRRSINSLQKGLQNLCNRPEVTEKFDSVDIEVVKDIQYLSDIVDMAKERLDSLKIEFSLPNADEISEIKQRTVERLKKAKIKKIAYAEKAMPGGMQLTDETRALLAISADNGVAVASGRRNGKRETISTAAHPMYMPVPYDPDEVTATQRICDYSETLLNSVKNQRAQDL